MVRIGRKGEMWCSHCPWNNGKDEGGWEGWGISGVYIAPGMIERKE